MAFRKSFMVTTAHRPHTTAWLELFGVRVDELRELWRRIVAPQLRPRSARTVSKAAEVLFGNLSDDIRRAAQISRERELSPEMIRETCQYGFIQLFGKSA